MYTAFHNLTIEDIKVLQKLTEKNYPSLKDRLQYILDEIAPTTKGGKLNKPFPITSVARADLVSANVLTEKEALKVDDDDMDQIAEKMGEAYTTEVFWIDLPIITEDVLE